MAMQVQEVINSLRFIQACFKRVLRVFEESDSTFTPAEGTMSVAQQVAHVAHTALWFRDGAFKGSFNLNFEAHMQKVYTFDSLENAVTYLDDAFQQVITSLEEVDDDWLAELTPPGPILGNMPRYAVLMATDDHTAHHRGALSVYARLLGKTPPIPYMDA